MTPNEYQLKAMRTLCNQHQAAVRIGGAAGPNNEWLDKQPLLNCPTDASPEDKHRWRIQNNLIPVQALHALIGVQGEAGELASMLQKWLYYGKPMTLEDIRAKVKDEAGDLLWYVMEMLTAFGLDLEEVMQGNIAKLAVRYPDKYTDEHAAEEGRDREAERKALEKHDGERTGQHPFSKGNTGTINEVKKHPRIAGCKSPSAPYDESAHSKMHNWKLSSDGDIGENPKWKCEYCHVVYGALYDPVPHDDVVMTMEKKTTLQPAPVVGEIVLPDGGVCNLGTKELPLPLLPSDFKGPAQLIEQDGHGFGHLMDYCPKSPGREPCDYQLIQGQVGSGMKCTRCGHAEGY